MGDLLNNGLRAKGPKDNRVTLILMIGSVFLFVYIVQLVNWHNTEKIETKSYVLNVENFSFSGITLNAEKVVISRIPWNLTPFFFKKMPINSADKVGLMTIKGIGPRLAESILQSRAENGLFKESADLLGISGVGPKRVLYFEKMFDFDGE